MNSSFDIYNNNIIIGDNSLHTITNSMQISTDHMIKKKGKRTHYLFPCNKIRKSFIIAYQNYHAGATTPHDYLPFSSKLFSVENLDYTYFYIISIHLNNEFISGREE